MRYRDFEVSIHADGAGAYSVEVRSPEGDARERVTPPAGLLAPPETALPDAADPSREIEVARVATGVAERGRALFATFFAGAVGAQLDRARAALDAGEGLRVVIRTDAPEVLAAPWEALAEDRPLAADFRTPVVRRPILDAPVEPERAARRARLRVLAVLASPEGLPALDLAAERARISEALRWGRILLAIHVRWLVDPTREELRAALLEPWDALHFAGHGGHDARGAYLALRAERGAEERHTRLQAADLASFVGAQRRLVVAFLSCCHGADIGPSPAPTMAHELLEAGLLAVVGMQGPISDRAATRFAKAVYGALGRGGSLELALTAARQALLGLPGGSGPSEDWIPALFLRQEVDLRVPWMPVAAAAGVAAAMTAAVVAAAMPPRFAVAVEDESGAPLAGAQVTLAGAEEVKVETDAQGLARFRSRARRARVRVEHPRYTPFEGDLAAGGSARLCYRAESAFQGRTAAPCYLRPGAPVSVRVGRSEEGLVWTLTVDDRTREEWHLPGEEVVIEGSSRALGPLFATATSPRRWVIQAVHTDETSGLSLPWWVEQPRPDGGVTSCERKALLRQIVPIEIRSVSECEEACRERACNSAP